TGTRSRTSRSTRAAASSASARRVTPKGRSVRVRPSRIAPASWSSVIVADARIPSAPASAVALTRRGPATQPMPVWTIGTSMPKRSQIRVCILMRLRPAVCAWPSRIRDFLLAETERVDDLADPAQLLVRGEARLGHVGRDDELESGRGHDVGHAHAGMDGAQAHVMVGSAVVAY